MNNEKDAKSGQECYPANQKERGKAPSLKELDLKGEVREGVLAFLNSERGGVLYLCGPFQGGKREVASAVLRHFVEEKEDMFVDHISFYELCFHLRRAEERFFSESQEVARERLLAFLGADLVVVTGLGDTGANAPGIQDFLYELIANQRMLVIFTSTRPLCSSDEFESVVPNEKKYYLNTLFKDTLFLDALASIAKVASVL